MSDTGAPYFFRVWTQPHPSTHSKNFFFSARAALTCRLSFFPFASCGSEGGMREVGFMCVRVCVREKTCGGVEAEPKA